MSVDNFDWLPDDFVCSPKWFIRVLEGMCDLCMHGKYIDGHIMRYATDRCKAHIISMIDNAADNASVDEAGFDDLIDDLMEKQS